MQVLAYDSSWDQQWDELVACSAHATFLHSRRFLSYHRGRFRDASLMLVDGRKLVAVLPAAIDPKDEQCVVSHPGATFGGLVFAEDAKGERVLAALRAVIRYYLEAGFRELYYKVVPHIYHLRPSGADRYALFRMGARWARSDLAATIELPVRGQMSGRRRRALRKAEQAGVRVLEGVGMAPAIWTIVEEVLRERYGVCPIHTTDEIVDLHARFPEQIRFLAGMLGDRAMAGMVLFESPTAVHVQYSVANAEGRRVSALDSLLEHGIDYAATTGRRYFDFGICTEAGGRRLNEGLLRYKQEFGAGTCTYDHYVVNLGGRADER